MKHLLTALKIIIILIFLYIIILLVNCLPDYISDEQQNLSGDEAGLTAMVITFLVPILLISNFVLIIFVYKAQKKIKIQKNN
jgi:hypothetical protein